MGRKKVSEETWRRARDLYAGGTMSARAIALEVGIPKSTIFLRIKKENWYSPATEAANCPRPPKKPIRSKKNQSEENETDLDINEAPTRKDYSNMESWAFDVLQWAIQGVAKKARHSYTAQCFLVQQMPHVIRALTAKGPGGDMATELENIRSDVDERLLSVVRPQSRPEDKGEVPELDNAAREVAEEV